MTRKFPLAITLLSLGAGIGTAMSRLAQRCEAARKNDQIVQDPDHYPLSALVWKRKSTNEWVLEITGTINDSYVTCRHTQPMSQTPDMVPGLDALYKKLENTRPAAIRECLDVIGKMISQERHLQKTALSPTIHAHHEDRITSYKKVAKKIAALLEPKHEERTESDGFLC